MFGEYYSLIFDYLVNFNNELKQDINDMLKILPDGIVNKCNQGKDFEDLGGLASYYLTNTEDYDSISMEFGCQSPNTRASYLLNLSAYRQEFFDGMQKVSPSQNQLTNFENTCEIATFNKISDDGEVMTDYTLQICRQPDGYHAVLTRSEYHSYEGEKNLARTLEKPIDIYDIMPFTSGNALC